jgi:hypothetical protein
MNDRPLLGPHGRANHDVTALGARHGTFYEQQLTGFVDANDLKVLHCAGDVAKMAGHALARENAPRILSHAD